MNLKRLGYFVTIVEEEQITKAAQKLHMAQPPLSQQLKLLEEELGVLLFERIGRKLELTEPGKVLYDKSKKLLSQYEEAFMEVEEVAKGMKGVLSIGTVKSCFPYVPGRLRQFREQFPDVTFRLKEGDTFRMTEYLRNREIELGIVRMPLEMEDFSSIALPSEPYVLVAPKKWNQKKRIRMKDVAELPLLLLHRVKGRGQYELILDECAKHGFEPSIICECPDAGMLLSLAREGIGYAMLPKSTVEFLLYEDLQITEIEDCLIQTEGTIIWLKDRYLSKAASRFLETFQQPQLTEASPL
ncbi:transcriptional regulator, lysr family [Bacillus sp. OxB-1]|uniref:LysR family transcriptional regulator n=1 Tax=Bacillus sp. (strain OxB-1) TaxID=98228 RepID=UPI00058214DE|nr:LysR family transcriptional regulator [Bacillus sp. OxB-1]BAQ11922.1 transcriptional regulator, lysr family [Bacillus sp. OxB-1]